HVRVAHLGGRACLPFEARSEALVCCVACAQQLDGHGPEQLCVGCPVRGGERPFADRLFKFVSIRQHGRNRRQSAVPPWTHKPWPQNASSSFSHSGGDQTLIGHNLSDYER